MRFWLIVLTLVVTAGLSQLAAAQEANADVLAECAALLPPDRPIPTGQMHPASA
jgi:hypothetical protein